jgi:hypothetical protein
MELKLNTPTGVRDRHGPLICRRWRQARARAWCRRRHQTSATGGRCPPRGGDKDSEQTVDLVAGQGDESQRWWVAGVLGDRGYHQERVGQHGQGHPPVPAAPAATWCSSRPHSPLPAWKAPPPASGSAPPGPGQPAAGRLGRRTRRRPAPRWSGCDAPVASAPPIRRVSGGQRHPAPRIPAAALGTPAGAAARPARRWDVLGRPGPWHGRPDGGNSGSGR